MSSPSRTDVASSLQRVRWAQAIVYAVIGSALVAAAVQSFVDVRRVSDMVVMGQGGQLIHSLRLAHGGPWPFDQAELDRLLAMHEELGLRCIAVFERDTLEAQAGSCAMPRDAMEREANRRGPRRAIDLGRRVAMMDEPPPRPPHPPPPRSPEGRHPDNRHEGPPRGPSNPPDPGGTTSDLASEQRWPPPGERPPWPGPRHHPPPPGRLLIEFEPIEANALEASATRSLFAALAAVGALVAGSLLLWRLSRRSERLQQAAERDRQLVSLGEMSAVLAHEIRNPLAAVKGHAQLLTEMLEPGAPERERAQRVVNEAIRLENLTEDLLSLVRSNQVRPDEVDPGELLREAARTIDGERLEVDTRGAPPTWRLDAHRMHQVLVNLLRNAAEASPDGTCARAVVRQEGTALVFTVRDTGAGIPAGEEERIFEPFYTTRVRGTGLGLAVARRIVELHGGSITARNYPGGGAEFRVVIPRKA